MRCSSAVSTASRSSARPAAGHDCVLAGKQHFADPASSYRFGAQLAFDLHALVAPPEYWEAYHDDEIDLPVIPPSQLKSLLSAIRRMRGTFGLADFADDVRRARRGSTPCARTSTRRLAPPSLIIHRDTHGHAIGTGSAHRGGGVGTP
jgi:hypothetical protein